jgi:hypothetical protein
MVAICVLNGVIGLDKTMSADVNHGAINPIFRIIEKFHAAIKKLIMRRHYRK